MAKIIISGMNGFIGTALSQRLTDDGNTVLAIPRELLYNFNKLKSFINRERPNRIYHLAAYGNHYSQQDSRKILLDNITATTNLLEAIKENKLVKFINISSSSVLLQHQTFYSVSKQAIELITIQYHDNYGIHAYNVRPYSVYGPGEAEHRFIPQVIKHLLNGETMQVDLDSMHDWIFIDDFINLLLTGQQEIGTGTSTSNRTVIETLETISGKKLKMQLAKLRSYDTQDWKAPKPLNCIFLIDGLQKTYDSYAKQYQEQGPQATDPGNLDQA